MQDHCKNNRLSRQKHCQWTFSQETVDDGYHSWFSHDVIAAVLDDIYFYNKRTGDRRNSEEHMKIYIELKEVLLTNKKEN